MDKRRIVIAIALAALLIVGLLTRGFGLFAHHDEHRLTLHGNVDIRQVDLGFRVGGRIAAIPFEEGAHVTAGAVLAQLDPRPLRDALAAANAQVGVAAAALSKQQNGNRPQEVAQAAAKVAEARAALARAKEDYDRRSGLVATGAISQALFASRCLPANSYARLCFSRGDDPHDPRTPSFTEGLADKAHDDQRNGYKERGIAGRKLHARDRAERG